MQDKDQQNIYESYMDETVATRKNIDRAKMLLKDPDTEPDDRQAIIDTLRQLEKMAQTDDITTVRKKIMNALSKITDFHFGQIREQGRYSQIVADEERFLEVAYKYYGDMEEEELKFHHHVLEELLEMDELTRREYQGQGPQRD